MTISFSLNGKPVTAELDPRLSLMDYLREIGLYSVKHGCDHGECGSCTVLLDGIAVNSCLIMLHAVDGRTVETLEGLMNYGEITPLQQSFIDHGAIQCGYCTPAQVLTAEALLRGNPEPSEAQVRDAMSGVLCRCTGYFKPVEAVLGFGNKEGDQR